MEDKSLILQLTQAFAKFRSQKHKRLQVTGISPGEMRILHSIGRMQEGHGVMVSEISNRLNVSPSFITQITNSLVNRGLVNRTQDIADRRAVRLRVTGKGNEMIQEAARKFNASFAGLVQYLGYDQSIELLRLMNIVNDYFSQREGDHND